MQSLAIADLRYDELLSIAREAKAAGVVQFRYPWVSEDRGVFWSSYQRNYPKAELVRILKKNSARIAALPAYLRLCPKRSGRSSRQPGTGPQGGIKGDGDSLLDSLFPGVVGQKDLKQVLIDKIYLPFTHEDEARESDVSLSPGFILYGPPGNGKTYAASRFCEAAEFSFHLVSATGFKSKWYGESERKIRSLFQRAIREAPSVIFIDEIDAITPTRGSSDQCDNSSVAELLTLLDGTRRRDRVAVIGTTNMIESIDPAIRRSGRLGDLVFIGSPDQGERQKLLDHLAKGKMKDPPDTTALARKLEGASRADIAHIIAAANGRVFVRKLKVDRSAGLTGADLESAVDMWLAGRCMARKEAVSGDEGR